MILLTIKTCFCTKKKIFPPSRALCEEWWGWNLAYTTPDRNYPRKYRNEIRIKFCFSEIGYKISDPENWKFVYVSTIQVNVLNGNKVL